jgi:hypothetical protein
MQSSSQALSYTFITEEVLINPRSIHVDMLSTKWQWGRLFSEYFGFAIPVITLPIFHSLVITLIIKSWSAGQHRPVTNSFSTHVDFTVILIANFSEIKKNVDFIKRLYSLSHSEYSSLLMETKRSLEY